MRIGTIFAHDNRAYQRWRRSETKPGSEGLTGRALESAVMSVAAVMGASVIAEKIPAAELAARRAEVAATELVPHPGTMLG